MVTVAGQTLTTTVQAGGTWSVTPTTLAIGSQTVVVSITDPSGNEGTATQTFTINEKLAQPVAAPATSTAQLQEIINSGTIPDVTTTTSSFVPSAEQHSQNCGQRAG